MAIANITDPSTFNGAPVHGKDGDVLAQPGPAGQGQDPGDDPLPR